MAAEVQVVQVRVVGHLMLCLLPPFPEWRDYILQNHLQEVTALARLQSWAAMQLLGMEPGGPVDPPDDQFLADIFFLVDVVTLQYLRAKYNGNTAIS